MSMNQEENYQAYQDGSIDAVEYAANYAALKLMQYRLDNPYEAVGFGSSERANLRHWLFCLKDANLDFDVDKALELALEAI